MIKDIQLQKIKDYIRITLLQKGKKPTVTEENYYLYKYLSTFNLGYPEFQGYYVKKKEFFNKTKFMQMVKSAYEDLKTLYNGLIALDASIADTYNKITAIINRKTANLKPKNSKWKAVYDIDFADFFDIDLAETTAFLDLKNKNATIPQTSSVEYIKSNDTVASIRTIGRYIQSNVLFDINNIFESNQSAWLHEVLTDSIQNIAVEITIIFDKPYTMNVISIENLTENSSANIRLFDEDNNLLKTIEIEKFDNYNTVSFEMLNVKSVKLTITKKTYDDTTQNFYRYVFGLRKVQFGTARFMSEAKLILKPKTFKNYEVRKVKLYIDADIPPATDIFAIINYNGNYYNIELSKSSEIQLKPDNTMYKPLSITTMYARLELDNIQISSIAPIDRAFISLYKLSFSIPIEDPKYIKIFIGSKEIDYIPIHDFLANPESWSDTYYTIYNNEIYLTRLQDVNNVQLKYYKVDGDSSIQLELYMRNNNTLEFKTPVIRHIKLQIE